MPPRLLTGLGRAEYLTVLPVKSRPPGGRSVNLAALGTRYNILAAAGTTASLPRTHEPGTCSPSASTARPGRAESACSALACPSPTGWRISMTRTRYACM